jgi:hypothetical protein
VTRENAPHVAVLMKGYGMGKKVAVKKSTERAVVVCTEARGVFFGYAKDTSGTTIKLRGARNCFYWAKPQQPDGPRGILGLGSHGPQPGSKVGPAADVELHKVSAVIECTSAAVAAWESSAWQG